MRQWIRKIGLFVSGKDSNGLDLSQLRITFEISKTENETPNHAKIKIFNLATDTENQIINEFTRVTLQAGYQDIFGVIFNGQIVQSRRGRENGTDTYVEISASDGDSAYNYAIVNTTLSAGSTQEDHINVAMGSMGIKKGYVETSSKKLPRGKVLYGNARDVMRQSAHTNGQNWSIQDGMLQMIKSTSLLPNEAVYLNSKSGLINSEQSTKGINVKSLLNPMIKIGCKVVVNEKDVTTAQISNNAKGKENSPAPIAKDGVYKVIGTTYTGDTYGNDWYCDAICVAIDATTKKVAK